MRLIRPEWPAPDNIVAFSTTREGGYSAGVYEGLNVAQHVGDDSETVTTNRQALALELPAGTAIAWLSQEHGRKVIQADRTCDSTCDSTYNSTGDIPVADASWTPVTGVACAVMTADCLPVLFCSKNGEKVAAAHAGWRGLARGVLESCVAAMDTDPSGILAWLGPAIGPSAFEVGNDVREQFVSTSPAALHDPVEHCFKELSKRPGFYRADLYALARIRLNGIGVSGIYGGSLCTLSDASRFYSYRRDGETGRMATVIAKILV